MKRTFAVITAVGRVTFLEIIRDKVLYNTMVCALFVMGAVFLASRISPRFQERVVLDFGLSVLTMASAFLGILLGSSMLGREFERRTALVALAKPISRFQFLLGKFCGLLSVLLLNWLLLSTVLFVVFIFVGGEVGWTLIAAVFFVFLQSAVAGAMAVFFSTFSTASLAVIMSIGFYLIGQSVSQIRFVAMRAEIVWTRMFMDFAASALPNFEYFQLGNKLTYGLPVDIAFVIVTCLYALVMIAFFLLFSGLLVNQREI
jgi:ABC-type transport system involved in multi-copper enzyme maturation permease subunit